MGIIHIANYFYLSFGHYFTDHSLTIVSKAYYVSLQHIGLVHLGLGVRDVLDVLGHM